MTSQSSPDSASVRKQQDESNLKESPDTVAVSDLANALSDHFSFLSVESFNGLVSDVQRLLLDDPILVLDWNDAQIALKTAANALHDKAALVQIIVGNGGVDSTGLGTVFSFRTLADINACCGALPAWSRSVGPIFAAQLGVGYTPPLAEAHVILATHKVQPDISINAFFRTI